MALLHIAGSHVWMWRADVTSCSSQDSGICQTRHPAWGRYALGFEMGLLQPLRNLWAKLDLFCLARSKFNIVPGVWFRRPTLFSRWHQSMFATFQEAACFYTLVTNLNKPECNSPCVCCFIRGTGLLEDERCDWSILWRNAPSCY